MRFNMLSRVIKQALVMALIAASWLPLGAQGDSLSLRFLTLEFPPYNYQEERKISGYSADLLRLIFGDMGYTTEFISMPYKRAQIEAASGLYAGVFSITDSPERREHFLYSDAIDRVGAVFYKRRDVPIAWERFEDLKDYAIGISDGYYHGDYFESVLRSGVLQFERLSSDMPEIQQLRRLQKGRIDLLVCPRPLCEFLRQRHSPEFEGIDYIDKPIADPIGLHVGFSRQWPAARKLRDRFNDALDSFEADGRLEALKTRYGLR